MSPLQKRLRDLKRKFSRSEAEMSKEIQRVLNANKMFLIELNTSQLAEGKDRHGDSMGTTIPYKSAEYATFKNQLNPIPGLGVPDLRLTGDYWDSIQAVVKNREFEMIATDSKAPILARYEGIGIAPENMPEISGLIRNRVNAKKVVFG